MWPDDQWDPRHGADDRVAINRCLWPDDQWDPWHGANDRVAINRCLYVSRRSMRSMTWSGR